MRQWSWLGSDKLLTYTNWPSGFKWFPFIMNKQISKNNYKNKTEASLPQDNAMAYENLDQGKSFPKKYEK